MTRLKSNGMRFAALVATLALAAPAMAEPASQDSNHGRADQAPGQTRSDDAPGRSEQAPGQQQQAASEQAPSSQPAPAASGDAPKQRPATSQAPAQKPAPAQSQRPANGPATSQGAAHKPAHAARPHAADTQQAAKPGHGAGTSNPHAKAGKTTICHSTGSAKNPYVTITISDNALPAHRRHHDGRDIIPAPAGGCPATAPAAAAKAAEPVADTGARFGARTAAPGQAKGEVAGVSAAGGVLGAIESAMEGVKARAAQSGVAGATAAVPADDDVRDYMTVAGAQLPFTGSDTLLLAMFGLGIAFIGTGLRKTFLA